MVTDKQLKAAALNALSEAFGRDLSKETLRLYLDATSDLTAQEFTDAAKACMRECKFFPTAADIRERAGKGKRSTEDRAMLAWGLAWDAAARVGSYESVCFGDPAITRAIADMGGWPAFCRPEQDVHWHRKTFLEFYAAHAGAMDTDAPTEALPGVHQLVSKSPRVPVMIGTTEQRLLPAAAGEPKDTRITASDARVLWGEILRRARKTGMEVES